MWIKHGEALINLAHASQISLRPSSRGHIVTVLLAGAYVELACYATAEQAKEYIDNLQTRLNRFHGKR